MQDLSRYLEQELPAINSFISSEIAKLDPLVAPAAEHVLSAGGKRLRPMLTILCARAAGTPEQDVYPLACSLEFLHSATLLHDDILDGADLRRGKKAAHLVFTRTETVLAGDVLLALANKLVAGYGDPRLTACLSEAIMRTAAGEVAEIVNLRRRDPERQLYLDIITGKTACLMEAACATGAMLSGANEELVAAMASFGLNLGIAFQMVDDALDYTSPSHVSGKPAGGDLREGKLTLPLILYLDDMEPSKRQKFMDTLGSKDMIGPEIEQTLLEMENGGYATQVRNAAGHYVDNAAKALEPLPESVEKAILSQALSFVLTREK